MITTIETVLTGKVKPFRGDSETSGIDKIPVSGFVNVGFLGLVGDEQADKLHHGGPDKAIHHYPFDHYSYWKSELGEHRLLAVPGGFGENISTSGIEEAQIYIGDRFRLGTALVEVSQGRQPCWKLSHRFGIATLTGCVVKTGLAGWYYRVIEPGRVQAGDTFELTDRIHPEWSVRRTFELLVAGKGKSDASSVHALSNLPELSESWRVRAAALCGR